MSHINIETGQLEYYLFNSSYQKLNDSQKSSLNNWFVSKYGYSIQDLESKLAKYHLTEKFKSAEDAKEILAQARAEAKKEYERTTVQIVEKELVANGNYYKFTAKLQNNTSLTIKYLKYTVYIYDKNGKLENSEWSNWSGTFKPNSTIMVDTMINRYDKEKKTYRVEIDEYKY